MSFATMVNQTPNDRRIATRARVDAAIAVRRRDHEEGRESDEGTAVLVDA